MIWQTASESVRFGYSFLSVSACCLVSETFISRHLESKFLELNQLLSVPYFSTIGTSRRETRKSEGGKTS